MVYNIWLEPGCGFTAYHMLRMWLVYVEQWHRHDIDCVGVVTDACGQGVSAGVMLMTPSPNFIACGCGYLGLPVTTQKFYFPFLRPKLRGRFPPPVGHFGEASHQVRKARSNLASHALQWIWQTKTEDGVVSNLEANLGRLEEVARKKSLGLGFSLKDVVTINSYQDQKCRRGIKAVQGN